MKKNLIINAGFIISLIILGSTALLSHWYMDELDRINSRESYTFTLTLKLDRLLLDLKNVRTLQRNYINTGEAQYLRSYYEALSNVDEQLYTLNQLTHSHPRQQKRLAEIDLLIKERLVKIKEAMGLQSQELPYDAKSEEIRGKGKAIMAEIRHRIAATQEETFRDLQEMSSREVADFRNMHTLLLAKSIIIFVLFTTVFLLFRRDIAQRSKALEELKENRDHLDNLVKARTEELENVNQALCGEIEKRVLAEENLRNLSNHLESVRETERLAISREIHDEIGQTLVVLKLDLSWIARRLDRDTDELSGQLTEMQTILDQLIAKTQRITSELRPPLLDNLGLAAAIEWQMKEFKRRSSIECHLLLNEAIEVPDKHSSATIMRILQEALTNIILHAEATEASISLCKNEDAIILEIADNGRGIAMREINGPAAYGIMGMHERARICHGELSIYGSPEEGTIVRLKIPMGVIKENT
ncbi:MAG: CHASE3 domain-containing protein [Desulfuromonadaceae bacterium]|nr:CHASE3 domain-containing protein [Desulfuromonadaceae bacterium]